MQWLPRATRGVASLWTTTSMRPSPSRPEGVSYWNRSSKTAPSSPHKASCARGQLSFSILQREQHDG